jgi:hypothetical protein
MGVWEANPWSSQALSYSAGSKLVSNQIFRLYK